MWKSHRKGVFVSEIWRILSLITSEQQIYVTKRNLGYANDGYLEDVPSQVIGEMAKLPPSMVLRDWKLNEKMEQLIGGCWVLVKYVSGLGGPFQRF